MPSKKNWRKQIWAKSNNVCAHCGKSTPPASRTVDHVIPQILGGGNDQRNLMPLCQSCNKSRASGEIIPETYYRYASAWALEELREYITEWKMAHTRGDGTLTVERYGVIEKP